MVECRHGTRRFLLTKCGAARPERPAPVGAGRLSQSFRQTSSTSLVTATSKLATPNQDTRRLGSDPLSFDIETTSGVSAGGHEERKRRGVHA